MLQVAAALGGATAQVSTHSEMEEANVKRLKHGDMNRKDTDGTIAHSARSSFTHGSSDGGGSVTHQTLAGGKVTAALEVTQDADLLDRRISKARKEKERRTKENELFDDLAALCKIPAEKRDRAFVLRTVIEKIKAAKKSGSNEKKIYIV